MVARLAELPGADFLFIVIVSLAITVGWQLHVRWMGGRLEVRPLLNKDKVIGYVLHLGRAHLGRYDTPDKAETHRQVVWKAIRGHR